MAPEFFEDPQFREQLLNSPAGRARQELLAKRLVSNFWPTQERMLILAACVPWFRDQWLAGALGADLDEVWETTQDWSSRGLLTRVRDGGRAVKSIYRREIGARFRPENRPALTAAAAVFAKQVFADLEQGRSALNAARDTSLNIRDLANLQELERVAIMASLVADPAAGLPELESQLNGYLGSGRFGEAEVLAAYCSSARFFNGLFGPAGEEIDAVVANAEWELSRRRAYSSRTSPTASPFADVRIEPLRDLDSGPDITFLADPFVLHLGEGFAGPSPRPEIRLLGQWPSRHAWNQLPEMDEVVERLEAHASPPIIRIGGLPGVGKTYLMSSLARQVTIKYEHAAVYWGTERRSDRMLLLRHCLESRAERGVARGLSSFEFEVRRDLGAWRQGHLEGHALQFASRRHAGTPIILFLDDISLESERAIVDNMRDVSESTLRVVLTSSRPAERSDVVEAVTLRGGRTQEVARTCGAIVESYGVVGKPARALSRQLAVLVGGHPGVAIALARRAPLWLGGTQRNESAVRAALRDLLESILTEQWNELRVDERELIQQVWYLRNARKMDFGHRLRGAMQHLGAEAWDRLAGSGWVHPAKARVGHGVPMLPRIVEHFLRLVVFRKV